jgi:HSP20 family protein
MFTTKLQRRLFAPDLITYPAAEVIDTEKEYTVTVEVPGLVKEDVTIGFEDGVLTIAGEKKEELKDENQKYYVFERSYGAFQRTFTFTTPVDSDKVEAVMSKGVLTIHLPKITAQKELGKRIPINEPAAAKA